MQSVRIRLDGYEASPACCSASLACIRPHAPSPMCIPQSSNAMMRRRDPRHALPPQRMPPLLGEAPRASSPRCMTPLLVGCSVARTSRTRHMCERASCPGMRDATCRHAVRPHLGHHRCRFEDCVSSGQIVKGGRCGRHFFPHLSAFIRQFGDRPHIVTTADQDA